MIRLVTRDKRHPLDEFVSFVIDLIKKNAIIPNTVEKMKTAIGDPMNYHLVRSVMDDTAFPRITKEGSVEFS